LILTFSYCQHLLIFFLLDEDIAFFLRIGVKKINKPKKVLMMELNPKNLDFLCSGKQHFINFQLFSLKHANLVLEILGLIPKAGQVFSRVPRCQK